MKVLHIISSGGMYGAEAVILNMSRTLNEGSHNSVLGVFSNSKKPNLQLHENALREGVESHLIPCTGQIDQTVIASIRELSKRTRADVVHAHGYKADVYVYLALRGSRTPFFSTCHSWIENGAFVSFYGMVDRLVLRNYAGVVAVSVEVKQRLLNAGVNAKKIHLIKNGIDLRPFDKAVPSLRDDTKPDRILTVGWVGRLSKEKGVDLFLRAAAHVLAECPVIKFVIAGEGPEQNTAEYLIEKLGIQGCISLIGRRDDMPSVYASLDVMVSSSRQEGLPMAILEGMASGLPIIATAVGDVPKVILDDYTGVIVPSEDVQSITSAIVDLLRDATKRQRLGAAARNLIEQKFSAHQMTAGYLNMYEESAREVLEAESRRNGVISGSGAK